MSAVGRIRGSIVVVLALGLPAVPASAQAPPDFLLKRPQMTLAFRGGYAVPTAASQVFEDARSLLTIEDGDLNALALGAQLSVRATERVDVALDFVFAQGETRSEFRDWVDTNDLPIEQTTSLSRRPVTLNLKWYFHDRGRSIGSFAWIPGRLSPYVGGGAGVMFYQFEQTGDFVDFETLDIFRGSFESSGSTAAVQGFAGVDVSLGPRFFFTGEGRYVWARDDMGRDFVGFDPIDLAGFQATVGLAVRF